MNGKCLFKSFSPCGNCPYRKDAPLRHWHSDHFRDVLENEAKPGLQQKVFLCHKKNGCICVGFMMNQVQNGMPNIPLRLEILKARLPEGYLDGLQCTAELYDSVVELVTANYPEILFEYGE